MRSREVYDIIHHMKRTTIFIEETVEKDLQAMARRQKRSTAAVIRDVLARYVEVEKKKPGRPLSIVGIGRSGRRDTAETHEDMLWSNLGPHGSGSSKKKLRKPSRGTPPSRA